MTNCRHRSLVQRPPRLSPRPPRPVLRNAVAIDAAGIPPRPAAEAAGEAGFDGYVPDACLINRYPARGCRCTRDRDEDDRIGCQSCRSRWVPATFLFGGLRDGDDRARAAARATWWLGGVDRMQPTALPVKPRSARAGRATHQPDPSARSGKPAPQERERSPRAASLEHWRQPSGNIAMHAMNKPAALSNPSRLMPH